LVGRFDTWAPRIQVKLTPPGSLPGQEKQKDRKGLGWNIGNLHTKKTNPIRSRLGLFLCLCLKNILENF